jgi:ribose transport system ATP-binding protein
MFRTAPATDDIGRERKSNTAVNLNARQSLQAAPLASADKPAGAALEIDRLSKTFAGNPALQSFQLSVSPGEIHVIVGQNGSGKSTLIKILSGYHLPDDHGRVLVAGEQLAFGSPDHSRKLGLRFVHQDLGLIHDHSILDNLSYGAGYPTIAGTIQRGLARRDARAALARAGLDVDPRVKVASLTAVERTGVALARALRDPLGQQVRVLVLDEPTATMPVDQVEHLIDMLRAIAAAGVAIVFVTHHLDEVFRLAHRVTVLRDGHTMGTWALSEVTRATLVDQLAAGATEITAVAVAGSSQAQAHSDPALSVSDLLAPFLYNVDMEVFPGEIVGIAGLAGSGRDNLLSAIFAGTDRTAGSITVGHKPLTLHSPAESVRAGLAYLPPDRRSGGLLAMSAAENLTLADLSPFSRRLRLDLKRERAETAVWMERLDVRPRQAAHQPLASYSGGNQQKVLLAKWLRIQPKVLLLDEPTQGVDVVAKAELHRQLVNAANSGAAVVISSSDIEEMAELCTRVLILRSGRFVDELSGRRLTQAEITRSVMKEDPRPEEAGPHAS